MKLLKDILNEITLERGKWTPIPKDELDSYKKKIFDLIQIAYTPIGGNPNFKSTNDIGTKNNDFEIIDINADSEPEVVNVSRETPAGTKLVATGHDGSGDAKRTIIRRKVELLKQTGYYMEVSGRFKDVLLAKGVSVVNDKNTVEKILAGKQIEWHGDGTYTRDIEGHRFDKLMIGKPLV